MIKLNTSQNFTSVFCLLFSIFIASISFGINIISFPAILLKNEISPFLIGISSSVEILSGVFLSFFLSKIISKTSIIKASLLFGFIYCVSILLIFFYKNFYLWLFFCLLNGGCWFALLVIRQTWINHLIHNKNRSIILALTTTIFCCGFFCGSFIVKITGATNYISLLLSSSFIASSIFVLFLIKNTHPKNINSQRIGFYEFFKQNPRIALAKLLLDLQNFCLISLTVVFSAKIGFTPEDASLLICAFAASGFCDLYAGFLAAKYDRYKMIKLGFSGCLITIIVAIFTYKYYLVLLILYFLFGSSTALIFVATLVINNESFAKEKLIAANSTLQSLGSIGSLIGTLCGGFFIEIFDFYGFFIALILASSLYLFFNFYYEKNQARS